ncbi:MAG: hypothetical protein SRB2_04187 [Desulfobacteraceae bacterium Eth-SRB2]|nr:MAG: hypothetical protein SRB2_04187 [Desulfobacteraceae bacterium Eth-SRB2]
MVSLEIEATNRIEKEIISFVLDKTDWNRTKGNISISSGV